MTKIAKLNKRFMSSPKDFTWSELVRILQHYAYEEINQRGKTAGSRRGFINAEKKIIRLHEPHPDKVVKRYVIKQIQKFLELE